MDPDGCSSLHANFSLPTVRHEVALPEACTPEHVPKYDPTATLESPARRYPFTLDPFQAISIACLEAKESVLVAAHTSAGKTVVAEYAIAMALRDRQRVVYTSPIKALSNQKYRELLDAFGDVGLMTGDVTINPAASCLVMTTEIYRSMLYRGSEVMREVAWVIYDEIHYMRDKERGVVWEETIILTPSSVRFVFLSATIPNALQFAEWISALHKQPCHVVYTEMRPTPLQHYVFGASGDGIHLVLDERKNFREDNLAKALAAVGSQESRSSTAGSDLQKIIRLIMGRALHPAIVFSFSRRECEANAVQMAGMDLNTEDEKDLVSLVFANATEALSEEDRSLPQIASLLPLLRRGIALHHSGLLPVLKEVIEILFQENLIKILFATETFAIGLNMPARTVVFTAIRKFDGETVRTISPGEYIQMSGRAGRRGIDARGVVILMMSERVQPELLRSIMCGSADPLHSAFRLSYNMVLNMMRLEGFHPEAMLERSFMQFQNRSALPLLAARVEAAASAAANAAAEASRFVSGSIDAQSPAIDTHLDITKCASVDVLLKRFAATEQLRTVREEIRRRVFDASIILPFLQPGRLVRVRTENSTGDSGASWGAVLSTHKIKSARPQNLSPWIVDVMVSSGEVVPFSLDLVDNISSIRMVIPGDLKSAEQRQRLGTSMTELFHQFPSEKIPVLSPTEDLGLATDGAFMRSVTKRDALERRVHQLCISDAELAAARAVVEARAELVAAQRTLHAATLVSQMDDLRRRRRVLRLLGFTEPAGGLSNAAAADFMLETRTSDVVIIKGRVACEISTGDELVLTELLFAGVFNALSVEAALALLSCFVCEERAPEGSASALPEELRAPYAQLLETARTVARTLRIVSDDVAADGDSERALSEQFRPTLMEAVMSWARGAKFAVVCKIADSVFEGSIIRTMRRLEELLRQLCQAAKTIGSTTLEVKFAEGITAIRRDIVFASSLYL
ncbi:hypothetical protein DI09_25p110 [Mitosporidium daphniae]|uniref:ATP-dependent RNA helicase DOB1 n=1 Tax=Mitosporidium daphniae TaxID=1485682 RepID=A0A098VVW3_9MICR|nr:uncharacterized protein DI09_25p110 [Mitosporidium daphniae]KGG51851.1 hypothetical protein DI09_25p110 [Mitosporidium daphniae]|eukprot:XP_013238278.1 uncharacterized protein DI09_25p110 [Mitosporidium daphniae]